ASRRQRATMTAASAHTLDGVLGPSAAIELERWAFRSGRTIEPAEPFWTSAGYTGARLVAATLPRPRPPRPVKANLKWIPSDSSAVESTRHAAALEHAPQPFAAAHLVDLVDEPIRTADGATILLQHIAGGSLIRFRPLNDLGDADLVRCCSKIISIMI